MKIERRPSKKKGLLRSSVMAMRRWLIWLQLYLLRRVLGVDVGHDVGISLRARIDFTNPRGVHIGDSTYIAFGAVILSHDMSRLWHTDTYIGTHCFVGANAIIMPGVHVGNHCIVGAGAVVTRDVPDNSIVVGNPAEVVRSGIETERWGILTSAISDMMALEAAACETDAPSQSCA